MMPAAKVAMSVTNAKPIINAAAVAAVRCGSRSLFWAPRFVVDRSVITPGNSTGQSGCHEVNRRLAAITRTISSISGFSTAPRTNAPTRRPVAPGPQAPYRSSQYGNVKNGQTNIEKTMTEQRAAEHEDQDLRRAETLHEQPYDNAGKTERDHQRCADASVPVETARR